MEPSTMASTSSWRAISGSGAAGALVGHDGGAGDDAKVGDTREFGDELVGHAVGEVFLGRVAGEVVEGEDGERVDGRATGSMEEAGSQRMGAEGEYRNRRRWRRRTKRRPAKVYAAVCWPAEIGTAARRRIVRRRDMSGRRGAVSSPGHQEIQSASDGPRDSAACNGCDEPVAGAGDCLQKQRQVRTVAQNLADFADCRVDSVFDIDEDFPLPKALGDFLPGDNLSMFGDQEDEEFERLPLELEPAAFAAKLKCAAMKGEVAELIDGKRHRFPPEVAEV